MMTLGDILRNSGVKKKIHKTIQSKIISSFMVLSLCFVLTTSLLVSAAVYRIYHNQTMERLRFEQKQLSVSLQKFTTDTNQFINSIIIQLNSNQDRSLGDMVASSTQDERRKLSYFMQVSGRNLDLLPIVKRISILLSSGELYSAAQDQAPVSRHVDDWYIQKLQDYNITTYGGFYTLDGLEGNADSLYYCKELRDVPHNRKVGYVILEIPRNGLLQYCVVQNNSAVVISEQDGSLIASEGTITLKDNRYAAPGDSGRFMDEAGISWLYVSEELPDSDWYVTCFLDTREAVQPIYRVLTGVTLLALLLLAAMWAVSAMLSRQLADPIKKLSAHMVRNCASLPQPIEPGESMSDETRSLYRSFNDMLLKNQQLFEDFKREEIKKQQIELLLVQSQIKPHFLYNTLDTIYCLANMKRTQEAGAVTKALADYYRVVLSNGQDWITLRQECRALEQYLTIMQTRFPELRHEIAIPEALENTMLPKLLLQPLVENAIHHGIRPRHNRGNLRIYGEKREDGAVELCVADDGMGMTEEKFCLGLQGVRDSTAQEPSFGLHSVLRRLKLSYGENSCILLEKEDQWTIVKIRFYPGDMKHA